MSYLGLTQNDIFFFPTDYTRTQMKKPVLIVLIGPTGVGKTELSLSIAEKYHYLYHLFRLSPAV